MKDTLKSPERTARLAGFLYLIVIICAGFSEGYVRSSLVVPEDAATTASNITSSEWLYRLGFASDLIAFMADAAIDFVERHRDEPFVLHVMFLEPHNPFTSPRDDQYDPSEVPLPENFEHDGLDDQPLRIRFAREATVAPSDPALEAPRRAVEPARPPTVAFGRLYSRREGPSPLCACHRVQTLPSVSSSGR